MTYKICIQIICFSLATCAVYSNALDSFSRETINIIESSSSESTFKRDSSTESPASFTITTDSYVFCQVRLDFKSFDVGNTNPNGNCLDNRGLIVTGALNGNGVPSVLCGFNDESHIYLNFDGSNPINLTMNFDDTQLNTTNQWDIEITQIPCSDTSVPSDCLQYYPESFGTVKSFNFRNVATLDVVTQTTYQLSNTDYYICIGPQTRNLFNTITWSKGAGTTNYYFVVNGLARLFGPDVAGTSAAAVYGSNCQGINTLYTGDYVGIPEGISVDSDGNTNTHTLYCGIGFPSAVTSTTKPFRLQVVTDGNEEISTEVFEGSIGFSLSYMLS